jgi:pSer/pThr/pTyr-binding forkhead associated (FHA) protein
MNVETIIVSAVVGVGTSAITAYVTTRLKMREEKEKWRREFAMKFADAQAIDNAGAQEMAVQFAIGVLIKDSPDISLRERIFIPPNCRLIAGRSKDDPIVVEDRFAARQHCAFDADDKDVYIEELGSPNGTPVNGENLQGRQKLESDDVVTVGETTFRIS